MLETLKPVLYIQELDMKMIRLWRLRQERIKELKNIQKIKTDIQQQATIKENEITELKKFIRQSETELQESIAKVKKLEGQQNAIKKVEEFNALTHEIAAADKERHNREQRLGDMHDKLAAEEEVLKNLQQTLEQTISNSRALEVEILESIKEINAEGRQLKSERDKLVETVDPEVLKIYERLLHNKKDRVVVPIENRCCSGCHIMLTAQDENLVRKGERLVFCEHCSRIHYWQESKELEGTAVATTKRRRRTTKV
jgi:predicted  nucleic acid-binding Zn-ribbon protein